MSASAPSSDDVQAALEELLGWSELARSPQLSRFLKHIVEARLRGDEAGIKAYSIAVDVFGRPASFDPQSDPIVRVQARRLRGLLQEYYRQGLGRSPVRITLPVGRYVPEFDFIAPETAVPDPPSPPDLVSATARQRIGRRFWVQAIAAAALVAVLGVLLVGVRVLREPSPAVAVADVPVSPTVYVSSFTDLTGLPGLDTFTSRLTEQLGSTLAQFEDVQVRLVDPARPIDKTAGAFLLSGTVAGAPSGIEVTAVLTDVLTGSAVWNQSQARSTPAPDDTETIAAVTRQIMRELRPFRGPLHARGRRWLDEHTLQLPAVNGYVCLLTYRYAREFLDPAAIAKALDCHDRLLQAEPNLPLALAAEAWLEGQAIYFNATPDDRLDDILSAPLALAERARELAPESPFVHAQLGSIETWMERYHMAQRHYAIALGLEPLNTDARANYAMSLARTGDWNGAARQADLAIADTPYPPHWYYFLPSLLALRDGRYAEAVEEGRIAAQGGEFGAVITLAAGGLARDQSAIADFSARVLNMERLRRVGILPWLRLRIKDEAVIQQLAEGLRAGGIPESALTAPF